MDEMNVDFPPDRDRFRQQFGYDFPYDSDEDPASIDEHYGNSGRNMGGSFCGSIRSSGTGSGLHSISEDERPKMGNSFKSSDTGSELFGITEEPLRIPLSSENLTKAAAAGSALDYMSIDQRRISELTNSYQSGAPLDISVISDRDNEDLMDAFLKSIGDASANSSNANQHDQFVAIDSSMNDGNRTSMRRESVRSKVFTSDKSVAEKSMAESTFFFGNISTSDDGTSRMSRERINIPTIPSECGFLPMQSDHVVTSTPTKFPMQDSDIELHQLMQGDDKSVKSALTCDRSYAIEESLRKLQEESQDEKTDCSINSPMSGNEIARTKSRTSSPASKKSNCSSSHYGSFMAWPSSGEGSLEEGTDSSDEEADQAHDTTLNESSRNCQRGSGTIVCEFPTDRSAFRSRTNSHRSSCGSFQSTGSSKGNSAVTSGSRRSSANSGSSNGSSKDKIRSSRRGSVEKRRSMRGSLETIKSDKSFNNAYRKSMRKSLSESIERHNNRSMGPRRKSLTQLHDEASSALPLMGWDDSNSDSSSLISSNSRKPRSTARKSFSSSMSKSEVGGLFCDEWMTRSSFKKGHSNLPGANNVGTQMPDEEFDSKKPWMKAPAAAANKPAERRGSAMTLDSSIISGKSLDKNPTADDTTRMPAQIVKPEKEYDISRSSFTSATSTLGDDQSISSDLTELRQAQEALLAVREDDAEEDEEQQEAQKLLESFTSVPKMARDSPSPTPHQLESVDEDQEDDRDQLPPLSQSVRLETVEEEQDDEDAVNDYQSKITMRNDRTVLSTTSGTANQFLDDLEFDVSQRSIRSPNEDDSDTYSDVEAGGQKSAPSLGLYMSVHNHEIEKEFNTTEMEDIDFKECRKPQDFDQSDNLSAYIESSRKKKSYKEDQSSNKSGKSSSKRAGSASLRAISNKWKPIKDRVKKKTGSNHVRRRHKRLYKFCVWNWKKITLLIALVLCVLAGIALSSWYGASRDDNVADDNMTVDDQSDDAFVDIQWPPVVDTGRNPIQDDSPTAAPSGVTSPEDHNSSSTGVAVPPTNSSSLLNKPSVSPSSSAQPTMIPKRQNTTIMPAMAIISSSPAQTSAPSANSFVSSPPTSLNTTTPSPTVVNLTFLPTSPSKNGSVMPSMYPDLNQTNIPSISPFSNMTEFPTMMPSTISTMQPTASPSSSTSTLQPTVNYNSLFQSQQIIAGEAEFQYTGSSVSMNPTGKFIVVGMKEAYEAGMVRVYVRKKGVYTPLGIDSMFGESPGDEFGSSVSISDDGKQVAVGARSSSVSGKSKNGLIKVYKYSESLDSWIQVGDTIEGSEDLERMGFAVDMSGNGLRVACGSPKGNGGRGSVSIYEYHKRRGWELVGDAIVGEKKKDMAGFSVSLSSDGSVVAIGAISASIEGLKRCGGVTVYSFDNGAWVKLGQGLAGLMDNAQFGYSLALSGDGKRLVVGSNGYSTAEFSNAGSCEVFELNVQTSKWKQIGEVFGDDNNEGAGYHVSMSENGLWVSCSKTDFASGSPEGVVQVLGEDISNEWRVKDSMAPYFENSTSFGTSTYLSQGGEHILIGAPLFNNSMGYVEVLSREE